MKTINQRSMRPTRFRDLHYYEWGGTWHFADADGDQIGRWYATRAELLADVERFASERGFA